MILDGVLPGLLGSQLFGQPLWYSFVVGSAQTKEFNVRCEARIQDLSKLPYSNMVKVKCFSRIERKLAFT